MTITSLTSARRERDMEKTLDAIADMAEHLRTCEDLIDAANTIAIMQCHIDSWMVMQAAQLMVDPKTIFNFVKEAKNARKKL